MPRLLPHFNPKIEILPISVRKKRKRLFGLSPTRSLITTASDKCIATATSFKDGSSETVSVSTWKRMQTIKFWEAHRFILVRHTRHTVRGRER